MQFLFFIFFIIIFLKKYSVWCSPFPLHQSHWCCISRPNCRWKVTFDFSLFPLQKKFLWISSIWILFVVICFRFAIVIRHGVVTKPNVSFSLSSIPGMSYLKLVILSRFNEGNMVMMTHLHQQMYHRHNSNKSISQIENENSSTRTMFSTSLVELRGLFSSFERKFFSFKKGESLLEIIIGATKKRCERMYSTKRRRSCKSSIVVCRPCILVPNEGRRTMWLMRKGARAMNLFDKFPQCWLSLLANKLESPITSVFLYSEIDKERGGGGKGGGNSVQRPRKRK